MVSYGTRNPMKKCFQFTHHPSGTLVVAVGCSLWPGPQEATRVEGKSAVIYESKDMECTKLQTLREREREREEKKGVNCLMDKESPYCLMYKNSSFFAFETFFPREE